MKIVYEYRFFHRCFFIQFPFKRKANELIRPSGPYQDAIKGNRCLFVGHGYCNNLEYFHFDFLNSQHGKIFPFHSLPKKSVREFIFGK